ncbi:hypothetical protein BKA67DRAFT_583863 [Truncatella angustata]|uniref:NmrA-like domain-containing protein n=1 Tax=Truncatella angustata TaxID=152316 RepID=A0A9P8RI86_9PEZI|nr:uncharacterized protein BKA67DRAFT_583863 [Truncatella angustata]KAH6646319.1 hypothetical protein BKA67DRAFT_583863 [Truncatella angustata]
MAQYFLSKVEGEEAVRRWADGGLRYTILRPCGFMSNWLAPWTSFQTPDLISEGVWHTAFSSDFPMPLIDTEDVGRIAAVAMQDPEGWHGREVELIAETLPLKEVIRLLSEVSGKQLRIHTYTEQEAEKLSKENPLVKGMMIRIKTDSLGGPPAKDLNLPFDLKTFRNYLDENREVVLETYAKVNNQTL